MTFTEQIRRQLSLELPGKEAQYKMAHGIRRHVPSPPPDVRIACVLLSLFQKQNEWHTLLIQRTGHDIRDKHKGQIGFPGGKQEASDDSLMMTALREAEEEVGLPTSHVEILGRLTELYIPVSNFIVHPFIGFVKEKPQWVPQPSEVAAVIETPIWNFTKEEHIQVKDIPITKEMILKRVPYYNVQGQVVWGATAMMLSEFVEVLQRSQNKEQGLRK